MIASWNDSYIEETIALWNEEATKDGYKEMTAESFRRVILDNPYFDPEAASVLLSDGRVKGFACGCAGDDLPLGDVAGYITCIVASEDVRGEETYGLLLDALERRFKELGKRQADVLFFNPMQLAWYIPNTPGHEHNNAPGIPVDGPLYPFLLGRGYVERARENAMYLPLAEFSLPAETAAKEAKAAAGGYEVGLYDPAKHSGIEEMLDGLNNPLWRREISACAREGKPVVVASKGGRAVGFAGPVIRQENGRGYFSGIGVHPDHEGHGLGTILFYRLCEAFKDIGTTYMSLYTGSTNPALRIYEKAGFAAVKQFAVLRKELLG